MVNDLSPSCVGVGMRWLRGLSELLTAAETRLHDQHVPLETALDGAVAEFEAVRGRQGRIWWAANGGSAAAASHISQDLVMRCGLSSCVLSDGSLLTCAANDHGYGQVYARPLSVHMRAEDLLVVLSSSGNSDNVVAAAELALERGTRVLAFSAFDRGNRLNAIPAAVSFYLPTANYGQAEIGHEALLHAVVEAVALDETR